MKICIQAGHGGRTSGATGTSGEQKWTSEIVPKIANILKGEGYEVKQTGADDYKEDSSISSTDWDLFVSIHYDADVYGDRGYFVDNPDPSVDFVWEKSADYANIISQEYQSLGIPNHPERTNANTRFYYMWSQLSKLTPCVLIEAGVGWRVPEDHNTLHFRQDEVAQTIANGIIKCLGEEKDMLLEYLGVLNENEAINKLKQHLGEHEGKCDWGSEEDDRGGFLGSARRRIKELESPITPPEQPEEEFVVNGKTETYTKDGKTITINYAVKG